VKRYLEALLARAGPAVASRWLHRDRVLVLAYHNVVPTGERTGGERSLHVSQRAFGEQLDFLAAELDVVPLPEIRRPRPSDAPRAVAITFDDAYRGALTAGVFELIRRDLPATVFVAPAFVGGRAFWWDALASDDGLVPATLRARCLESLRGDDTEIREWARAQGRHIDDQLPAHASGATEVELATAVARPGITLGAHSWSHPNLVRIDDERLHEELQRPLDWLRQRFPTATVPWLAYPYGLESDRVRREAARAGYEGALRISGGWHRGSAVYPHAIPRLNVSAGLSRDGFVLRASGLLA
jgi:peptidoglycan/xylan/chitin deacetylase (PgdA/CDA1 family)